jgi:ribose transport system permease protein
MRTYFTSIKFRDAGTMIGLILISIVFASMSPTFLTAPNLLNVLQQSSINACIALGMTLVIISGGIDLSVGPVAALTATLGAAMLVAGVPIPLAILGALAAGVACGFVNGALIAWGGLQPFIVTLGGLSLYRALALIYTGGQPIFGLPDGFRALTNGTFFDVPTPVIIVAALAVVAWVILNKTPLGEYFMAIGGNPEAARIAGVPVVLTKLAAVILIGRLGAAEPTMGTLWELDAIAASAIGGASLMGGRGSIPGTLIGCIILGTLRNGLTLLNVQAFYQLLATGIIIIVAMLIDKFASGAGGGKQG